MMSGKRHVEHEDGDERGGGQRHHGAVAQRAPADAHHRLEHDGEHRRLEPEEQRLDQADIAVERIEPAQRHDGDEAGQHEQHTRR
jgi:hypothetical protein